MADQEADKNIEIWKIKKLIKALEAARGNGTSMISLIMPPRDQISHVTKMLGDEFGTIVTDDGKEKVTFDFEPFRPMNVSTLKTILLYKNAMGFNFGLTK
ncbi:eukaryotic peptide chain release factor subunit 1-2-like [Castanea sativa]|uniref:eukaryotic peptide chain release factor subunit 1-2-like n=1 Tax=Castanea sativa TaxID=21020 RepID=UPI003F64EADA